MILKISALQIMVLGSKIIKKIQPHFKLHVYFTHTHRCIHILYKFPSVKNTQGWYSFIAVLVYWTTAASLMAVEELQRLHLCVLYCTLWLVLLHSFLSAILVCCCVCQFLFSYLEVFVQEDSTISAVGRKAFPRLSEVPIPPGWWYHVSLQPQQWTITKSPEYLPSIQDVFWEESVRH